MASQVRPIPEGYHTVSPHLAIRGGLEAMEFYKKAFGAEERGRFMTPDGKQLMHGEVKIGDSIVMLGEENPNGVALVPRASAARRSACFSMCKTLTECSIKR